MHKIALLAHKYECTIAVGRSTTQWFDHLYHANRIIDDLGKLVEAAFLLDESVFFARFSTRFVLTTSILAPQISLMHTPETQKLALMLLNAHATATTTLRTDLDDLVDRAARCFSREFKHYVDWAPDMSPEASASPAGKPAQYCRVDGDGGQEFLGALRDANIWPSGTWYRQRQGSNNTTMAEATMYTVSIGTIVDRLAAFREPDYNDVDQCEFCDQVKVEFVGKLRRTQQAQKERLWGLCLDCFKAGGVNDGECRFEHSKRKELQRLTPNIHLTIDPAGPGAQQDQAPAVGGWIGYSRSVK